MSKDTREVKGREQLLAEAIALWSTALLLMLAFGVLYSLADYPHALDTLRSYREFLNTRLYRGLGRRRRHTLVRSKACTSPA